MSWCWRRMRREARRGPAPGSRTIPASRRGSRGSTWRRACSPRPTSSERSSPSRGPAQPSGGEEVAVVGGGNSAGQAVVFLARAVRHVHMLVRGPSLAESMSRYLIRCIEELPNVTIRTRTRIVALEGSDRLEAVRWRNEATGEEERRAIRRVFLMIGADPNTAWLGGCVA